VGSLTVALSEQKPQLDIGDIVVYKVKGRDIPIVHRVLELHERWGGHSEARKMQDRA
jgi:signal peptidase